MNEPVIPASMLISATDDSSPNEYTVVFEHRNVSGSLTIFTGLLPPGKSKEEVAAETLLACAGRPSAPCCLPL